MRTVRGTHAIARYGHNINGCPSNVIKKSTSLQTAPGELHPRMFGNNNPEGRLNKQVMQYLLMSSSRVTDS